MWRLLASHCALPKEGIDSLLVPEIRMVVARTSFHDKEQVLYNVAVAKPDGGGYFIQLCMMFSCVDQQGANYEWRTLLLFCALL
jgi:hypothetical protein